MVRAGETTAGERIAGDVRRRSRRPVRRTNQRHQWEKDRAREPEPVRARSGATERDTGLTRDDLVFHAVYAQVPAGAELAGIFGVPAGTPLLERTYRTRHRAERCPFALVRSYLVRDLAAANPALLDAANEPWPGGTHNQLLTVGVELDRIDEHVTARPPTAQEAAELGLPPGSAVLVLRKTAYDSGGRVVEVADVTLPGDRTEMRFTTRLAGG